MSRDTDRIPLHDAVIVEPGEGATSTVSSLRAAVMDFSAVPELSKQEPHPASVTSRPAQGRSSVSIPDGQAHGRQLDVKPTSESGSVEGRRQPDVRPTSLQGPSSTRAQARLAKSPTTAVIPQGSPHAVQLRGRAPTYTEPDESGRYRHTVRLEAKIERQLQIIMTELGLDMNAAFSVCIATQFRQLKRTGNRED